MRLAKIKNKYLFKSENPDGFHTYAVYYDRKSKNYRAVQLTHLYVKDEKRFRQVSKGLIKIMKFKEFDVPSGVRNQYYSSNVRGEAIDLRNKNVLSISKRHLSKYQSDMIKAFAKKPHR